LGDFVAKIGNPWIFCVGVTCKDHGSRIKRESKISSVSRMSIQARDEDGSSSLSSVR
jgi:hypothetical protein